MNAALCLLPLIAHKAERQDWPCLIQITEERAVIDVLGGAKRMSNAYNQAELGH